MALSRHTQIGAALAVGIGTSVLFSWSDHWLVAPAQAHDADIQQERLQAHSRYVASVQQDAPLARCFHAEQMVASLKRSGGAIELPYWRQLRRIDCNGFGGPSPP